MEKFGSHEAVKTKLSELEIIVNGYFSTLSGVLIEVKFEKPIYKPVGSGFFEQPRLVYTASLGQFWGTKVCQEVDVAHHITADLPGVDGHSNVGQNYCNLISGIDFDIAISQHSISSPEFSILNFVHELTHTLGAGHEETINLNNCVGDNGYFMCSFGTSAPIEEWELSSSFKDNILNNVLNAECTGDEDESDCMLCDMMVAITTPDGDGADEYGTVEYNIDDIGCNASNLYNGYFTLVTTGGCTSELRMFEIRIPKYNGVPDVELFNLPPEFSLTLDNSNESIYSATIEGNPNLMEETQIEFIVNKLSAVNFPTNSNSFTPQYPTTNFFIKATNAGGLLVGQQTVKISQNYWYAQITDDSKNLDDAIAEQLGINSILYLKASCGLAEFNEKPLRFIIKVDGDFEMDNRNCFKNKTKLYFTPDSKLRLKYTDSPTFAETRMIMEEAIFDVCGNTKWKGIETQGPSHISISGSQILNADIRIKAIGSESMTIENSIFTNNCQGLYLEPYLDKPFNANILFNNTFTADNNYLPSTTYPSPHPLDGIYLNKMPLLWVNFGNFSNLRNGIRSINSNLVAHNSTFTNIFDPGEDNNILFSFPEGNGIYSKGGGNFAYTAGCVFNDTYRAIGSKYNNLSAFGHLIDNNNIGIDVFQASNRNIDIKSNTISANNAGIQMQYNSPMQSGNIEYNSISTKAENSSAIMVNEVLDVQDLTIHNNPSIKIPDNSIGINIRGGGSNFVNNNYISASDPSKNIIASSGVNMLGSAQNYICDNDIVFPQDAAEASQSKGIFLSSGSNNFLGCNETTGGTYGINTWGQTPAYIGGNTFDSNYLGLYYGLFPSEGNVNTTEQILAGNIWENGTFTNGLFGAQHLNQDPFLVGLSQYQVDISDQPFFQDFNTMEDAVINTWILPVTQNEDPFLCSQYLCDINSGIPDVVFGAEPSNNPQQATAIANGNILLSDNYNTEANWIADLQLYNILSNVEENNGYVHPTLSNFTSMVSSELSYIGDIGNQLTSILTEPTSISTTSTQIDNAITYVIDNISSLDSAGYASQIAQLQNLNEALIIDFTSHHANASNALSSLKNDISMQSGSNNANLFFGAYGESIKLIKGDYNDLSLLHSLANTCAIEGGEAVYMARNILTSLGLATNYDDNALCNRPSQPRSTLTDDTNQITIFPNPTTNVINIESKIAFDKLVIRDISGVLIDVINEEINKYTFGSELSGVYLLEFSFEGKKEFKKVILVK